MHNFFLAEFSRQIFHNLLQSVCSTHFFLHFDVSDLFNWRFVFFTLLFASKLRNKHRQKILSTLLIYAMRRCKVKALKVKRIRVRRFKQAQCDRLWLWISTKSPRIRQICVGVSSYKVIPLTRFALFHINFVNVSFYSPLNCCLLFCLFLTSLINFLCTIEKTF